MHGQAPVTLGSLGSQPYFARVARDRHGLTSQRMAHTMPETPETPETPEITPETSEITPETPETMPETWRMTGSGKLRALWNQVPTAWGEEGETFRPAPGSQRCMQRHILWIHTNLERCQADKEMELGCFTACCFIVCPRFTLLFSPCHGKSKGKQTCKRKPEPRRGCGRESQRASDTTPLSLSDRRGSGQILMTGLLNVCMLPSW